MRKFSTIAQNDLNKIQRCKHTNTKVFESFGDLDILSCNGCGSIVFEVGGDNPQNREQWITYILDPMTIYELFKKHKLDVTFLSVE